MIDQLLALAWILAKILCIIIPVFIAVAYSTFFERKVVIVQHRVGPNRAGPFGLLQPLADVIKLMFKEIIHPAQANKVYFVIAPLLTDTGFTWAVIPFNHGWVLANINAGLLYLFAMSSPGIYGIYWPAGRRTLSTLCLAPYVVWRR